MIEVDGMIAAEALRGGGNIGLGLSVGASGELEVRCGLDNIEVKVFGVLGKKDMAEEVLELLSCARKDMVLSVTRTQRR